MTAVAPDGRARAVGVVGRLISARNRIYEHCGLNDLEQLEDTPEYDPSVVLDAETVRRYVAMRTLVAER